MYVDKALIVVIAGRYMIVSEIREMIYVGPVCTRKNRYNMFYMIILPYRDADCNILASEKQNLECLNDPLKSFIQFYKNSIVLVSNRASFC